MPKPKVKSSADFEDDFNPEILHKELPTVQSPSGSIVHLMNDVEVQVYQNVSERYCKDNKFAQVSDLLELDRLLNFEIMCFRMSKWQLTGVDYDGNLVMNNISKEIRDLSKEIRDIKAGLGIDKKTRDKDAGSTIADLWENLRRRAGEFGIHRNEQVIKCHTMWKELQGLVTLYKNSTDVERTQFKCHEADIFAWLEEKFAEFDAIDDAFRLEQKIWIRDIN